MSSINVQVNRNNNIISVGINSTGPQGPQGIQGIQGPPGDKGDRGSGGVVTLISTQYAFQVKEDGNLYVIYTDEANPPKYAINAEGYLVITI